MNKINTLKSVTIAMLLTSSAWAGTDNQAEMPMMNGGSHSSMMGEGSHGMMSHHRHHNMSTQDEVTGSPMNPQMMQMRQQHMSTMELHLANIETLLEKLLEIQKP